MNYYEKMFMNETQMNILREQIIALMEQQLKAIGEWVENEPIHAPAYMLYLKQLKGEKKSLELYRRTAENYKNFGENHKKFEE